MKTREQNKWVCKMLSDWARYHLQSAHVEEEGRQYLVEGLRFLKELLANLLNKNNSVYH